MDYSKPEAIHADPAAPLLVKRILNGATLTYTDTFGTYKLKRDDDPSLFVVLIFDTLGNLKSTKRFQELATAAEYFANMQDS